MDDVDPTRSTRPKRGFSLLETLFAGTILIIGLTSTAGVFGLMSATFAHQRDMAIATGIAEAFLEQVAILPPSSPLLEDTSHPPRPYDSEGHRLPGSTNQKFTLTWTITPDTPVGGMKEVLVDVAWRGIARDHQVSFFTFRE